MDEFARAAFREREAKRIVRRRAFVAHVCLWAVVNAFLVLVWALAGGGYPWFLFPLAGWGVGLVAHGVAAFLLTDPDDVVLEREQRRFAQEQGPG